MFFYRAGEIGDIRIALSSDVVITSGGRILRSDDGGIAIAFDGIDEDRFAHLKLLVQYNADDVDQVDRELMKAGITR